MRATLALNRLISWFKESVFLLAGVAKHLQCLISLYVMPSIIIPFTFGCYKCFHEPRKDRKFISQCATFSKSHFKRAHATGLQRSPKEYLYANLFNTPYHMLSQSVISWLLYIEMPILMSAGAVLYEYLARTELLSTFFYNCSFTRKKFLKDKGLQRRDFSSSVFLCHHQQHI